MQSLLDVRNVAQKVTDYGFGLDAPSTARALRKLADALESGEVLLQKVTVYAQAHHDDFPTCGLVLQLVEMLPECEGRKRLDAAGSPFPVAVVDSPTK